MLDFNKRDDPSFIINDLERVDKEFLEEKDKLYRDKIYSILSYSASAGYYKINIVHSDKNPNLNLREYFESNFKTGKEGEKLEKFLKENNTKLII